MKKTKFIFITGGVCSSLGKGLTAASLALLLEKKGLKVGMLKLDPYLNVDPGTMSPYQHGEVYVTDDGAETDLDLGHYYRYSHSPLSRLNSVTSGQIYFSVINRERRGDYLGATIQVVPHITNEIKQRIYEVANQEVPLDAILVEIGGTAGDIESLPFLEAIRQFRGENPKDCLNVHLTFIPFLKAAGEFKTKPAQHSTQILRGIGIFPDIMICRSEHPFEEDVKDKISLFCNIPKDAVIEEVDVKTTIYELPLKLEEQKVAELILDRLGIENHAECDLSDIRQIIEAVSNPIQEVTIGVVGKYVIHQDAYKSVFEALYHAGISHKAKIHIKCFEADKIIVDGKLSPEVLGCDGYLVPGGFGERGWLGKILTAEYCRENKIPYFGICLGLQVMLVEFARNVLGLKEANSTEFDKTTKDPVVSLISEQEEVKDLGGSMRLGAFYCTLKKGSLAYKAYKQEEISERHRHRYEFNNFYKEKMEEAGLSITGTLSNGILSEIGEVKGHPWMVGVQFHPEFKSRPFNPHPLFVSFVEASIKQKRG